MKTLITLNLTKEYYNDLKTRDISNYFFEFIHRDITYKGCILFWDKSESNFLHLTYGAGNNTVCKIDRENLTVKFLIEDGAKGDYT